MQGIEGEDQPGADLVTDAGLTTAFVLGANVRAANVRGGAAIGNGAGVAGLRTVLTGGLSPRRRI